MNPTEQPGTVELFGSNGSACSEQLPVEAEGIWRGIWLEEAHHSTAIEGNTLVLKQVQQLLDEGRAVGNKELREYMEVQGYANAADWVYGQALASGEWSSDRPITLAEVRHIHRLALGPVWAVAPHPDATPREGPGSFREHDIQPFPGGMQPPSWPDVPPAMSSWLRAAGALRGEHGRPFPERLANLHARLEQIHPFLDGNGRTGRLVLNLLLVRLGYPPAVVYKRERSRYLAALRRADQGDLGPLGEMLARAVLDNLYKFVVPAVAGPNRLVPLPALATKRDLGRRSPRCCGTRAPESLPSGRRDVEELARLGRRVSAGAARRRPRPAPGVAGLCVRLPDTPITVGGLVLMIGNQPFLEPNLITVRARDDSRAAEVGRDVCTL